MKKTRSLIRVIQNRRRRMIGHKSGGMIALIIEGAAEENRANQADIKTHRANHKGCRCESLGGN